MDLVTTDLNDINFDNDNFVVNNPETFVLFRLMTWCNSFKQRKGCGKKDRWRINAYSMASNNSLGLVYGKGWTVVKW